VGWKHVPDPDPTKPARKVPIRPRDGEWAKSTNPDDRATLAEAEAAVARYGLDGVGVVLGQLPDGRHLAGADLDTCVDPETGEIAPWARKRIAETPSYAEISPSGTGVKIICFVDPAPELPKKKRTMGANGVAHPPAIEVYTEKRFFALTFRHLDGSPDEIVEITPEFERLARFVAEGDENDGPKSEVVRELLAKDKRLAEAWKNGTKIGGGADDSASGHDFALATYLGWNRVDPVTIEATVREWPHGQIGSGKLTGKEADRQIERLLEAAAKRRQDRKDDKPGNRREWPDPLPLPEGLPAVQPFDPIMLPDRLRPWVADVCERMQVPMDYVGTAAVTCLGAVVGRRVGIHPKRHDDWRVVPNLWGAIVGRPGIMKTPALQESCSHVAMLEKQARQEHERAKGKRDQGVGRQGSEEEPRGEDCRSRQAGARRQVYFGGTFRRG
jgi:hypothetical protein